MVREKKWDAIFILLFEANFSLLCLFSTFKVENVHASLGIDVLINKFMKISNLVYLIVLNHVNSELSSQNV